MGHEVGITWVSSIEVLMKMRYVNIRIMANKSGQQATELPPSTHVAGSDALLKHFWGLRANENPFEQGVRAVWWKFSDIKA
jgi:hypothetical protein